MRCTLVFACFLVLACACGSRTGLAPPAGDRPTDAARRDAGPADAGSFDAGRDAGTDAGAFDAGPFDAGAPCTWRIGSGPFEVFRDTTGAFIAPIVIRRDSRTDLFATYIPSDLGRRIEVRASQLDAALAPTPPVRLSVGAVRATASAAAWAGMISMCVPASDGDAHLLRFTPVPTYPMSSRQPVGMFDRCLGSAATPTRMIVAYARAGVSFISAFGPGGGLPSRRALRDPGRSDPVAVATVGEDLVWAAPSDGFGQIEVGWIDGPTPRSFDVPGFPRVDGVPPALAEWPFAPGALAILGGVGLSPRLAVVSGDGAVLLRSDRIPGQMFARPVPALARARGGLLFAQLDFGDLDPRGGLLRLSLIGRDGIARELGLPSIGVRRPADEAGAEIAAAGDTVTTVVHWTGVDGVEPVTNALVLVCD